MEFSQKLKNYAHLLARRGMNIQEGQIVNITGEVIHRDFINMIVKEAYECGAKYVNVDFIDPSHTPLRVKESKDSDYLTFVPDFVPVKFNNLVDSEGALLRLVGSEEPDSCSDLSPEKVNTMQKHYRKALKRYYDEGIGKSKVQWTVAAAATPKWGKKVFPELSEEQAGQALWEEIFKICRVDTPDYLQRWKAHNTALQQRAKLLTYLKIKELQFVGPSTDLKVYLSPQAIFKAGGDISSRGQHYECNIPTEECFTTPDYRLTSGHAKVTRPFIVNGKLIKDLKLEFKEGKIIHFEASEGAETFAAYINSDDKASYLGEVALVGIDSPIFQSQRIFEEILFDENAACHIAVGFAYRFCLDQGDKLSDEALEALGCNSSCVHTDMMISDANMDVIATTYSGQRVLLLQKGIWQNLI